MPKLFNEIDETEPLKDQSRPSVSNITSIDVRFATILQRAQFCDIIGQRHKFHCAQDGPMGPKLFNEADETDPLISSQNLR